jgi:hypothetical protein
MKLKQTQLAWIRAVLKTDKVITRNYCLKNHISRLGAYIQELEYDDWKFEVGYTAGKKDYQYKLVKVGK